MHTLYHWAVCYILRFCFCVCAANQTAISSLQVTLLLQEFFQEKKLKWWKKLNDGNYLVYCWMLYLHLQRKCNYCSKCPKRPKTQSFFQMCPNMLEQCNVFFDAVQAGTFLWKSNLTLLWILKTTKRQHIIWIWWKCSLYFPMHRKVMQHSLIKAHN